MSQILIHQIFYDEQTRSQLDPDFIPLDNTAGPADWFEFLPILKFLQNNELAPDTWYGFMSPKFPDKTGCSGRAVRRILEQAPSPELEAFLFSTGWDQISYFRNVFEQGEFFHPGMRGVAQQVLDRTGLEVDLTQLVNHLGNAVFNNYIVAKSSYWSDWQRLATRYLEVAESPDPLGRALASPTSYALRPGTYAVRTFIQERLATVLLATGKYTVANVDFSTSHPVFDVLFEPGDANRERLRACNVAKRNYCKSKDATHLAEYYRLRAEVQTTFGGGSSYRDAPAFQAR